ncbi:MAG: hypothetical protein HY394_01715 [Candidatus Diapherotrites archaeon]|nr:hypothetical protein [Candidatus Diapherotrites archaeon]
MRSEGGSAGRRGPGPAGEQGRERNVLFPGLRRWLRNFRGRKAQVDRLVDLLQNRQAGRAAFFDDFAGVFRRLEGRSGQAFKFTRLLRDHEIFGCVAPDGKRLIVFPDGEFTNAEMNGLAAELAAVSGEENLQADIRFTTVSRLKRKIAGDLRAWERHLLG